ncbi:hypothetical protein Vretifemale_1883 [Volvox reticuliferus]|nr:hypothetical protein Vretifemale_1883 [Volvox reticuliferus]
MAAVLQGRHEGCCSSTSGSVGQLTASFDVLGLGRSSQTVGTNLVQGNETDGSMARLRPRLSQTENKENNEITPSRLDCLKQLRDELTCAVCLDVCVRPCTTPCGHNYCRSCLRRNTELNRPCPKCRADLPPGFTLNINTSLWNTIQHLFPSEASAKPLTPPPAQPQQPTGCCQFATRRNAGQGFRNAAGAPFHPPRFVTTSGDHGQPIFTGRSSSRANANDDAAHAAGMGSFGMASLSGRSVSGPRPQRPPSGVLNPRAAPPGAAEERSGSRYVFSLAELGVHPGRDGGTSRRDRRRSRSAERWESGQYTHVEPAAADGPIPNNQPPSGSGASRLLQLLSGTSGNTISTTHQPAQPHDKSPVTIGINRIGVGRQNSPALPVAAASLNNNPFLRPPRPAALSGSASAVAQPQSGRGTVARTESTGSSHCRVGHQAPGTDGTMSYSTASQRALLGAAISTQVAPAGARAASSRPSSTAMPIFRSRKSTGGATDATSHAASATSLGSGSCTGGGGSSSRSTLASIDSSWSVQALDEGLELGVLPQNDALSLPCSADGAMVTTNGDAVQRQVKPSNISRPAAVAAPAEDFAGGASPTWSELDEQMARALEPLCISPPRLPRLRVLSRRAMASPEAGPLQPDLSVAGAARGGQSTVDADNPAALSPGGRLHGASSPMPHNMDPDLASNYDGEDPAGAETFFSSPFFDRNLLVEGLQEAAAEAEAGISEVGISPLMLANLGGDADLLRIGSDSPFPDDDLLVQSGVRQQQVVTMPVSGAPQPGDRECPIELLSDSDMEDSPGQGQDSHAAVRVHAAMLWKCGQRVVSGLRRPHRT